MLSGEEIPSLALSVLLDRPDWHGEAVVAEARKGPLFRLGAQHLLSVKAAATSPSGLLQLAGMMVKYLYRLGAIEAKHEAYRGGGRIASTAPLPALALARD